MKNTSLLRKISSLTLVLTLCFHSSVFANSKNKTTLKTEKKEIQFIQKLEEEKTKLSKFQNKIQEQKNTLDKILKESENITLSGELLRSFEATKEYFTFLEKIATKKSNKLHYLEQDNAHSVTWRLASLTKETKDNPLYDSHFNKDFLHALNRLELTLALYTPLLTSIEQNTQSTRALHGSVYRSQDHSVDQGIKDELGILFNEAFEFEEKMFNKSDVERSQAALNRWQSVVSEYENQLNEVQNQSIEAQQAFAKEFSQKISAAIFLLEANKVFDSNDAPIEKNLRIELRQQMQALALMPLASVFGFLLLPKVLISKLLGKEKTEQYKTEKNIAILSTVKHVISAGIWTLLSYSFMNDGIENFTNDSLFNTIIWYSAVFPHAASAATQQGYKFTQWALANKTRFQNERKKQTSYKKLKKNFEHYKNNVLPALQCGKLLTEPQPPSTQRDKVRIANTSDLDNKKWTTNQEDQAEAAENEAVEAEAAHQQAGSKKQYFE